MGKARELMTVYLLPLTSDVSDVAYYVSELINYVIIRIYYDYMYHMLRFHIVMLRYR
ncbi:hypothetical protein J6590_092474 [Homalodisca vitripennis]|nr:hypothetical protein J6590_092474 [Homalodisca vitripennis]